MVLAAWVTPVYHQRPGFSIRWAQGGVRFTEGSLIAKSTRLFSIVISIFLSNLRTKWRDFWWMRQSAMSPAIQPKAITRRTTFADLSSARRWTWQIVPASTKLETSISNSRAQLTAAPEIMTSGLNLTTMLLRGSWTRHVLTLGWNQKST